MAVFMREPQADKSPLWDAVAFAGEILAWLIGAVWIVSLAAIHTRADECPPPRVVVASYDGLVFVQCRSLSQDWDANTVYFFRDGRVIAERRTVDGMQVSADGGDFVLTWLDGGTDRLIRFRWLVAIETVVESHVGENLEWFDARRRMTDLEKP